MITTEENRLISNITKAIHKKFSQNDKGELFLRDELFHYGVQGLLEAKSRFDSSKNVPWLIFASYRIRGVMLDNIRKQPMVKLPHDRYKEVKMLDEAKTHLFKIHGKASIEMLAERLEWTVEKIHKVANVAQALFPQSITDREGDSYELQYTQHAINPEDEYVRNEFKSIMKLCIESLEPRDKLILVNRVMKGVKLREMAELMACSAENIRLRQVKAEKQLKSCFEKNGWPIKNCIEVIT